MAEKELAKLEDLNKNQRLAIKLLGVFTRNHFSFLNLAGSYNLDKRHQLLTLLNDGNKVLRSKCGITLVEEAFMKLCGLQPCIINRDKESDLKSWTCLADRDEQFSEWAKAMAGKITEDVSGLSGQSAT